LAATFVQATAGTGVTSGLTASAQYSSNVTAGNLLVAVVKRRTIGASARIAVANVCDDVGNKWKQATEGVTAGKNHLHGVDVWYCDQAGGANRPIVTATVQGFPDDPPNGLRVLVLEYGGGAGGYECVDSTGCQEIDGRSGSIRTRDTCAPNDLLVSVIGNDSSAFTAPSGFTSRLTDTSIGFAVADKLDSGARAAQTATWTRLTHNTVGYGVIVAFKTGGIRTGDEIRLLSTQYRLEPLGRGVSPPPGTAISPAFNGPTAGNTLICFVSPYVDNDVVAIDDDHGNTWRRLFHCGNDTIGLGQNAVWIAQNVVGSAPTITLTATMVAGESILWNQTLWLLMEYVNLAMDAVVLTSGNALMHAPSNAPTASTRGTLDGRETLVLSYIGGQVNNFDGLEPKAGWHSRWSDSMGSNAVIERVVSTAVVQTAGWTYNVVQGSSLFVIALGAPNPRRRAHTR
jgi:hypothetical protein